MQQDIRFCTARDGVRIAYATSGTGYPLVKAANWLNHLEYDWESPVWRHTYRELSRSFTLIRYDERGTGLSDREVDDVSFESWVADLEAVVEAAGVERFALLGISQGGPVSIAYAVRHPARVSHLVTLGAYGRGWRARPREEIEAREALLTLVRTGWGRDNPAFRQVFTSRFIPGASLEQMRWFNELQRKTASAEMATRIINVTRDLDVMDTLSDVTAPTLVLHATRDGTVPLHESRLLAAGIPDARFVAIESANHLLLEDEPGFAEFLSRTRRFLGAPEADPTEDAPVSIGRYRLGALVGRGAMGSVYAARDERLARDVAVKVLSGAVDAGSRQRLLGEARHAAGLSHPNICTVHEVEVAAGRPYIVMELVPGASLDRLVERGPLDADAVADLGGQVAAALAHAHDHGIVHRDVKCSNVIRRPDGRVTVLDFGVARRLTGAGEETRTREDELLGEATVAGTLAYMAPEVVRGARADARSDIWSVGVVLAELATGRRPFSGTTGAELASTVLRDPPALEPGLSDPLRSVIERCLHKQPEDRYQRASDLEAALSALAGGSRRRGNGPRR